MFLMAAALTLLAAIPAHAGTLEDAKRRGSLIVGVREHFPPLGYLDARGKHSGFEVDLARYLGRQLLGDESRVQLAPVHAGNRLTTVLSESADMLIAAVTVTEDRASVLAFCEPYFLSGTLLLVPRNSSIKDFRDVTGKNLAVIAGSIQEGGVEPVFPGASQVKFWRVSNAVRALRTGKVDAFAEDDVLVLALAREYPDLVAVVKPFRPHPYAIALRKGDEALRAWVNDQLRKAKADGTYEQLWNKYFGEEATLLLRP
jgi:polar amino acid transport system substrate-binding protein